MSCLIICYPFCEGEAFNHLGYAYGVVGQWAEAIEQYHQPIAIQENIPDLLNLGHSWNDLGKFFGTQIWMNTDEEKLQSGRVAKLQRQNTLQLSTINYPLSTVNHPLFFSVFIRIRVQISYSMFS